MKITTFNHKYFISLLNEDKIGVDLTLGKGSDTLFLADHLKKVYAFDIQKEAIAISSKKLRDHDNVIFILDDHANIKEYVKEKIDIVFFNSGYLPDSQSPLITKSSSSLKALSDAYDLLNEGGYLSIALYKGHEGGLKEAIVIKDHIKDLNIIETYKEHKSLLEPELFIIKK